MDPQSIFNSDYARRIKSVPASEAFPSSSQEILQILVDCGLFDEMIQLKILSYIFRTGDYRRAVGKLLGDKAVEINERNFDGYFYYRAYKLSRFVGNYKSLITPLMAVYIVNIKGKYIKDIPQELHTPELINRALNDRRLKLCDIPNHILTKEVCLRLIEENRLQSQYCIPRILWGDDDIKEAFNKHHCYNPGSDKFEWVSSRY